MTDVLERAKAALEGVTKGPWHWSRNGQHLDAGDYDEVLHPGGVDCMSYCYGGTSTLDGDNLDRDRQFIAAARQLVPDLVAEVVRLRTVLTTAKWGTDLAKAHYETNTWSGCAGSAWDQLPEAARRQYVSEAWPWADAVAFLAFQEEDDDA